MVFTFLSIFGTAWNIYDNSNSVYKFWKGLGLTKDYFILKLKNPEIFVSLEKIYILEKESEGAMEKISDKILQELNLENGIKALDEGIEFEMSNSHIKYTIQEKHLDIPGDQQHIVVFKTDTKLYYPFRQRAILEKLQEEFYKICEIITSAYNFKKTNQIINLQLNIDGINKNSSYDYEIKDSEISFKDKFLQINTKNRGDNYSLIITAIILWYIRFPEVRFINSKSDF